MIRTRQFASDNYAGICPEAWAAMAEANQGHVPSYGDDPYTAQAAELIREVFQNDCEVFFVFNGTAANSVSLAAMCQSYHSVLCHEIAHIETDECGAPEFFSNGTKLLQLPGENGKIDPASIEPMVKRRTDIHFPKPRVITMTQATEVGTVYTPEEMRAVSGEAHRLGLTVHMDGARFANAVAALNAKPSELSWEAGVDVMSFGGTKNGNAVGEAVVFFNHDLVHEFEYRCKQAGQLASKMRFLAAPWVGMLREGAWLRYAKHANEMAALLERRVQEIPGISILFPRQANSVFAQIPPKATERMREAGWRYYDFIGQGGARLMCSWDTAPEDVETFATCLRQAVLEA